MLRRGFRRAVGVTVLTSACTLACASFVVAEQDCVGLVAKRVELNQQLTITREDSAVVRGTYAAAVDSGLFVNLGDASNTFVPTNTIRSIEFRDESRPRFLYATVGFFAGIIAGGLIGGAVSDDEDAALKGGSLGLVVGPLLGLTLPIDVHYDRLVTCDSLP